MQSNCLSWYDKNSIEQASYALWQGKIILSTTDTVLGLLASTSLEGKLSLDKLKIRNEKPYIVLCDSLQTVYSLIDTILYQRLEGFMKHCWPGPVTLICTARGQISPSMQSKEKTIAIRIPYHAPLQELLTYTGPLFSTSANKSGMPVPVNLDAVDPDIKQQCALIITDEMSHTAQASTILDCTGDVIRVIREGVYPIAKLKGYTALSFEKIN